MGLVRTATKGCRTMLHRRAKNRTPTHTAALVGLTILKHKAFQRNRIGEVNATCRIATINDDAPIRFCTEGQVTRFGD